MPRHIDPPTLIGPRLPDGFELLDPEQVARRLGFRIVGDRQQIGDDAAHMQDLRNRGFENWETG